MQLNIRLRSLILEKNGLQSTDDSATKLKNEFVLSDVKRYFFAHPDSG